MSAATAFRPLLLSFIGLALGCADPSSGGRCVDERDCRAGQACIDGRCGAAPSCALDTDCPQDQICRDGACGAQSCLGDADCPGRRCIDAWCQPRASSRCADDGDCEAGACDRAAGLCRLDLCPPSGCAAGCAGDADCPDDAYCAGDGLCRAGCRADGCGRMASAALCDSETRRCVTVGCAADGDCPGDAYCAADRVCRPGCRLEPDACPGRCDRVTRRCGCAGDGDCPADAYCADDGVCRPGCRMDGCPAGACDPAARRCVGINCLRDADCDADQACGLDDACHPARGPLPVEAGCGQPGQCASGRCVDGLCQGRCAGDDDCPSGRCALVGAHLMCAPPPDGCSAAADCAPPRTCRPWWGDGPPRLGCQPPVGDAPGGARCLDDRECQSGACPDGRCWIPCSTADDCPGACLPAVLVVPDDPLAPAAGSTALGGCLDPVEGSGAPCDDDGVCPMGEACGLWVAGSGFEGRCRVALGAGLGGEPCATDADCRGRWCADARCVAPCGDGAGGGCAAGAGCADVQLDDRSGGAAAARVCGVGGEAR